MKYKFENDLEQNRMSMKVVDARRFAPAVRSAMRELERVAKGYGFYQEDYYLDTKAFLEQMATRLEAKPGMKIGNAGPEGDLSMEDLQQSQKIAIEKNMF